MICPACNHALCDPFKESLFQCQNCCHVFQFPNTITAKYDLEYVSKYDNYPGTDAMSHLRCGFIKAFRQGGTLLDVGCGNGSFVKTACKSGFDAYGNDIHNIDVGVRMAPLNSDKKWDVITFFDSLEHFEDLSVIKTLRSDMIVISMPFRPTKFPWSTDWKHYRPGEHLHYFTTYSLCKLFSNKALLKTSDLEDTIRGRCEGNQNIFTTVFA